MRFEPSPGEEAFRGEVRAFIERHLPPDMARRSYIRSQPPDIERVSIDLLRIKGDDFNYFDKRLLSLYLVKYKLTAVAMFDVNRTSLHASEFLYKESLMVIRGNFRPPTIVTLDVIESSYTQFKSDSNLPDDKLNLMLELTVDYLKGENSEVNEKDFLERSDLLCALGYKVLLSDCANHEMLINYLSYKISNLGLVIGARELQKIITDRFAQNQDGRLLVSFGELFSQNIRIYVYPALDDAIRKCNNR